MSEKENTLIKKSGENLATIISEGSFQFWESKEFRQYINFEKISKGEQDRIFNELLLTSLGLFFLHLDYILEISKNKTQKQLFKLLQIEIYRGFLNIFTNLGTEEKFINEWRILIALRLDEYRKNYLKTSKYSKNLEEMDNQKLKIIWCRVETMVISGVSHIRRGKFEEGDPLIKHVRKWLIPIDVTLGQIYKVIIDGIPIIKVAEA